MTDRIHSLTVVLEREMRDDDVDGLAEAIRRLRNVCSVSLNVAELEHYAAKEQARRELTKKLLDVLT